MSASPIGLRQGEIHNRKAPRDSSRASGVGREVWVGVDGFRQFGGRAQVSLQSLIFLAVPNRKVSTLRLLSSALS